MTPCSLTLLLSCVLLANGASISRIPDSYANLHDDDIEENLIPDEEVGDIEGLLPPKLTATDYYSNQVRNTSYVMDPVDKVLRLVDHVPDSTPDPDYEAVKEVTDLFSKLLAEATPTDTQFNASDDSLWKSLRPTVRLTDEGITLEFAGTDDKSDEVNIRDTEEVTTTNYDGETFTTDVLPDDADTDTEVVGLVGFFHSIWDIIRTSVDYAGSLFGGLVRSEKVESTSTDIPVTEVTEVTEVPVPSSSAPTGSLVALEEPLAHHRLPAHEFERGRDIDSLLYGKGIA